MRSENKCQEEIIDFNSSFDEIDSKFMAGAPKESEKEASQQDGEQGKCEVVFRTPMRRFTFNPLMTSFEEVASHLINNSNEAAGLSKLDVARWTERHQSPPPSSIYSVTDSDYASVDFDFFKETEPLLSPIKDVRYNKMDANMDDDEPQSCRKRHHPDPLDKANSMLS